MLGCPINWLNFYANRFVLHEQKKEWLETTTILGRVARVKAGCPIAEKGHPLRQIYIHQIRTRYLDKDGLYASCKPIVDALKVELRRKVDGKFTKIAGAGIIWNDDPSHADWHVTQELADGRQDQTFIKIEIT